MVFAASKEVVMVGATRFIDRRRKGSGRRRDEAQVLYLRHAARSAGEAFAFEEEFARTAPSRSYATIVWMGLALVAAIGLAVVYSG